MTATAALVRKYEAHLITLGVTAETLPFEDWIFVLRYVRDFRQGVSA